MPRRADVDDVEVVLDRLVGGDGRDIEIDRIIRHVHRLDHWNTGTGEHLPYAGRLVDPDHNHRFGMIAEHDLDRLFFLLVRVARVGDQHLDAAPLEHVLHAGEEVVEHTIGQRWNDHTHDVGAR